MAKLDIDTASLEAIAGGLRDASTSAMTLADWAIANHERRGEAFHAYKSVIRRVSCVRLNWLDRHLTASNL